MFQSVHTNLAVLYAGQGQLTAACDHLTQADQLQPNPKLLLHVARMSVEMGEAERLEQALTRLETEYGDTPEIMEQVTHLLRQSHMIIDGM